MNEDQITARYDAAIDIARAGGELAMTYFRNRDTLVIEGKGDQDMVSQADRQVEVLIRDRLTELFPEDGFFGEEGGQTNGGNSGGIWVVDPIDGTACFVVGIPVWCVSIAFLIGDDIEIGVVFDPNSGEIFAARRGRGATLDGVPIQANPATSFTEGTVGIGYSPRTEPKPTVDAIGGLLAQGGMFQRNGSGALMISYVAAGRLIGYYEPHINSWDCLAGIALVLEAGGWANDFLAGDGLTKGNAIAVSGPHLKDPMRRLIGLM
jgi:myo-inositol-1(or 4)-monophosphatase